MKLLSRTRIALRRTGLVLALLALTATGRAAADAPVFEMPALCVFGLECFIQQYPDRDPRPETFSDYTCGGQTYDGHDGLDIRTRNLLIMRQGIPVLAMAAGRVMGVRDGLADISIADTGPEAVAGVECGNGVLIDHGDGWSTQYCHLRQGSVQVQRGEEVEVGNQLGLIGHSGMSEFPHLQVTVRKDGETVDPFTGETLAQPCDAQAAEQPSGARIGLWSREASDQLRYHPVELMDLGFLPEPPTADQLNTSSMVTRRLDRTVPAIILIARTINVRAGDEQDFVIYDPNRKVMFEFEVDPLEKNQAVHIQFAGTRAPETGFEAGLYRGEYRIHRDGETILVRSATLVLD